MRRPSTAIVLAGVLCTTLEAEAAGHADAVARSAAGGRSVEIAPSNQAITFARTRTEAGQRVLAVARYADGVVTGVDLSLLLQRRVSDPIDVLRAEGWDALHDRIEDAPRDTIVTTPAELLDFPVDLAEHHVGAGTNYPEHAGEAGVEDGPFLFAKLVRPTDSRATVSAGDALLDYEVELGFVTLDTLAGGERPATMGLVACNDYTDRASLLRHVDVWNPASGDGFTTGKSFPGYLPVGDLFVVPRDVRSFAASLELRLWINGELRQHASASQWVWDLDRILAETWSRRDATWDHRGTTVSLLSAEKTIPARTLIMAGTPSGTVFKGVDFATRARGAFAWLLGGWDTPLPRQVVEAYIREARDHDAGGYLKAGDRVVIEIERLGVIDNEIVP